ncbi:deoxycytidylate deaminase, partial [bacterium]|nr:deoxycytidylate deaminase [bacterium]
SVFLRWDKSRSVAQKEVSCDRIVPFEGFVAEMLSYAAEEAKKASNWWRQTGAIIARDKEILLMGYNRQVPSPRTPYIEGDSRSFFKKGLHIELTTDMHAEARLISMAAKKGISIKGTDLYITTFPCPFCAKLVAYSGIKRCYFKSGYAMLDGERILRSQGVEIIFVK